MANESRFTSIPLAETIAVTSNTCPARVAIAFSLLPAENATGNYVKVVQRVPVRIEFDAGQYPEHLLQPGMSVEPTVWLR